MSKKIIDELIYRYPCLNCINKQIIEAYDMLKQLYSAGNTVFLAGNGGSHADTNHFAGELMKGFLKKRPVSADVQAKLRNFSDGLRLSSLLQEGIPAIPLGNGVISTAILNDIGQDTVFAQPLYVLGCKGDVFVGFSTSGNSKNVYYAAITAKALNMLVISFTGATGGILKSISDVCINVPEKETYKVQELHMPIYHAICAQLEEDLFE